MNVSVKLPRVLFSDDTVNVVPLPVTPRLFGPLLNTTLPLGLTVKLIVPVVCFENENGLGLVVTWTVHGVGVGVAPGDGDGVAVEPGDAEGVALGVGSELGVGVGVGSDPIGDGVGVGVASCVGEGSGVGFGLLLPLTVEPESMPVSPPTLTFTFGTSSR